MDNSPTHKSKLTKRKLSQLPVHLAPHPPYSLDSAPSDFFLFEYLKEKMLDLEFDSPETLLEWMKNEFRKITPNTLEAIFEHWIIRVAKCIEHEGNHFLEGD
jgi:hypothetical protein